MAASDGIFGIIAFGALVMTFIDCASGRPWLLMWVPLWRVLGFRVWSLGFDRFRVWGLGFGADCPSPAVPTADESRQFWPPRTLHSSRASRCYPPDCPQALVQGCRV